MLNLKIFKFRVKFVNNCDGTVLRHMLLDTTLCWMWSGNTRITENVHIKECVKILSEQTVPV